MSNTSEAAGGTTLLDVLVSIACSYAKEWDTIPEGQKSGGDTRPIQASFLAACDLAGEVVDATKLEIADSVMLHVHYHRGVLPSLKGRCDAADYTILLYCDLVEYRDLVEEGMWTPSPERRVRLVDALAEPNDHRLSKLVKMVERMHPNAMAWMGNPVLPADPEVDCAANNERDANTATVPNMAKEPTDDSPAASATPSVELRPWQQLAQSERVARAHVERLCAVWLMTGTRIQENPGARKISNGISEGPWRIEVPPSTLQGWMNKPEEPVFAKVLEAMNIGGGVPDSLRVEFERLAAEMSEDGLPSGFQFMRGDHR